MARAPLIATLLCIGPAVSAGECGFYIDGKRLERVNGELQRAMPALAAYGESLSRPEANSVDQLVHELLLLEARLGRVAMLAEIRDAMRHGGEKSFVRFKLSHEAAVLKLASNRAHDSVEQMLSSRPGIEAGVARLLEAIAQAETIFAACDSPM